MEKVLFTEDFFTEEFIFKGFVFKVFFLKDFFTREVFRGCFVFERSLPEMPGESSKRKNKEYREIFRAAPEKQDLKSVMFCTLSSAPVKIYFVIYNRKMAGNF
ncbi:MAG: hypothetical protein ACM3QX_04180 [Syntrophomonadaceae bacterium]